MRDWYARHLIAAGTLEAQRVVMSPFSKSRRIRLAHERFETIAERSQDARIPSPHECGGRPRADRFTGLAAWDRAGHVGLRGGSRSGLRGPGR